MAVATYTKSGSKATTPAKLDKAVFGVVPKDHTLLKDAYVAYLSNGRDNLAITKTRGLIRGGGRKPWKQKGTGRARFGSSRNPIWRSGGIVFGPTGEENYSKQLNVKAKRQAIRQSLSLAATSDKIKVVQDFVSTDGKTKPTVSLLAKLEAKGNTLIVVTDKTASLKRAVGNLSDVKLTTANYLNVYDILNADTIILSQEALTSVSQWLGQEKVRESK